MTSPSAPVQSTSGTCCGKGGSWAPKADSPRVVGCMLCPNAKGSYWRDNRADGQPYEPVKALDEADSQ